MIGEADHKELAILEFLDIWFLRSENEDILKALHLLTGRTSFKEKSDENLQISKLLKKPWMGISTKEFLRIIRKPLFKYFAEICVTIKRKKSLRIK